MTSAYPCLSKFQILERGSPSQPALGNLEKEIFNSLSGLGLPSEQLRDRRIGVTVGSRGIARLRETVRAACSWLKAQGAEPFVFPAMGSHGGGTDEGQRKVLES